MAWLARLLLLIPAVIAMAIGLVFLLLSCVAVFYYPRLSPLLRHHRPRD